MPDTTSVDEGGFSAAELENSAPFDPDKRLRGEAGTALLDEILAVLDEYEGPRLRKRKAKDEELRRLTLDCLLANLIALRLNRVDSSRFLGVSFNTSTYTKDYAGSGLSLTAMQTCRDGLVPAGLIDVVGGFQKVDTYHHEKGFKRRTRIRATEALGDLFEQCGIERPSVKRVAQRGVIHLKDPDADAGPEPEDVTSSRPVIEKLNARLQGAHLALPAEAWARIRWKRAADGEEDRDAYRANAGDETAKVLARKFNRRWNRGGRIYGGWWMHVPGVERPLITIDGEAVVELDYSHLHPSLLFHRESKALDFDPYDVPGLGPLVRDVGKNTFQRLINKTSARAGMDIQFKAAAGEPELLPIPFKAYLKLYKERLAPIAHWFGRGVGMELQREDSDLAVDVLDRMDQAGAVCLPIHDSFIVQSKYEETLSRSMDEAYYRRYGFHPNIK